MNESIKLLSDITHHMKYARYLEKKGRRETYEETVTRNKNMMLKKFPKLKEDIDKAYQLVYDKKVLPSMRGMQFGGKPIELNHARLYNCSFAHIDNIDIFSEAMFLLLSGCGFGFSSQLHHVNKLPRIKKPFKTRKYLIGDSIEGWADAIKALVRAYLDPNKTTYPIFDYDDIRPKGAKLITSGGKAPGPQPLKDCIHNITKIFESKAVGEKLSSLDCHSIMCYIADAVLSGGIRRAAMISLFSFNDEEMRTCKFGKWYEKNPHFARANNSAVVHRQKIKLEEFKYLFEQMKESRSGEPGIFFTWDSELGLNPCGEISLKNAQFCNLCTINASNIENQKDFEERVWASTIIGTLQASFTNFHYLRDIWKETCEKDALLGVSMTGIASEKVLGLNFRKGALLAIETNKEFAQKIGINPAARITCIKPEGTSSSILGSSSGIHAWHSEYYIRRIRVGKNEDIYHYLLKTNSHLIEDEYFKPETQAVISIPIKAPEDAITREESALSLLERIYTINKEWIFPSHQRGLNTHNTSATITVKEDEWDDVCIWMWNNKEFYNCLTILPYDTGTYKQTPFEEITEEQYNEMVLKINPIDLLKINEKDDFTNLNYQIACAGGACELSL